MKAPIELSFMPLFSLRSAECGNPIAVEGSIATLVFATLATQA
jgi:hypothetical protein